MSELRRLKVYEKFRESVFVRPPVPEIRLIGKWLDRLGFHIGSSVLVKQEPRKLTITLEEEEGNVDEDMKNNQK